MSTLLGWAMKDYEKQRSLYTFNAIFIERPGEATTGIYDLGAKFAEGDILTFF